MGFVNRIRTSGTTEIVAGAIGDRPVLWRCHYVPPHMLDDLQRAALLTLPVEALLEAEALAKRDSAPEAEDPEHAPEAEEAKRARLQADLTFARMIANGEDREAIAEARVLNVAIVCASVSHARIGPSIDAEGHQVAEGEPWEPICLVPEGPSTDAAGGEPQRLAIADMPPGAFTLLARRILDWQTGGEAATKRLANFRPGPGAAADAGPDGGAVRLSAIGDRR